MAVDVSRTNQQLKAAGIKVRLVERGRSIQLQATLPLKPGDSGSRPKKQYRLNIGALANEAGLRYAKSRALELGADMSTPGQFSWTKWLNLDNFEQAGGQKKVRVETAIADFKAARLAEWPDKDNEQKAYLWRKRFWNPALKWLEHEYLDDDTILDCITHYRANSRARQQMVQILKRLCTETAERYPSELSLTIDWAKYAGDYSPRKAKVRTPKNEQEIYEYCQKIPNPRWRKVFMLMALYGLRDHECWHCTLEKAGTYWVAKVNSDTKTGERIAFPLNLKWMEEWVEFITHTPLPKVTAVDNTVYGERTARQFKRYGIPFIPYGLRHAVSKRGRRSLNIPGTLLAESLGHSERINEMIYQRQLTSEELVQYWDEHLKSS